MKIITINLPEQYFRDIQTLNDLGKYPSRSEAIRMALRDFLREELNNFKDLDPEQFKSIMRSGIKN